MGSEAPKGWHHREGSVHKGPRTGVQDFGGWCLILPLRCSLSLMCCSGEGREGTVHVLVYSRTCVPLSTGRFSPWSIAGRQGCGAQNHGGKRSATCRRKSTLYRRDFTSDGGEGLITANQRPGFLAGLQPHSWNRGCGHSWFPEGFPAMGGTCS